MTVKTRRATVVLCSAIAALATSALAKPVRHYGQSAAQAAQTVAQLQTLGADHDTRFSFNGTWAGNTIVTDTVDGGRRRGRQSMAYARARAQAHSNSAYGGLTSNALVSEARKYIGTNPTGRGSLWCGAFMDMVLKRTGHAGGGNLASAYARYGTRVSGPQVGAIAVMGRRGGGHVGVVSGVDPNGNPIIVSGNHNHTVAESVYPAGRISAYVLPGG
ncbi:MAG TPA: TIGR02594 family protein [Pseudolabrys sp.]|jgi:uncharacterized protein (TIGR02594 family)|nr:TIGR02594 family protein [Pseudolabrys sp.]